MDRPQLYAPNNSGQRSPLPYYYRGCWHVVGRGFSEGTVTRFFSLKAVYNPKAFFPHAASLCQLSPIAQDSPLLLPVGVWAASQSQCGWSRSHASYLSSPCGPSPHQQADRPRGHPGKPISTPPPCDRRSYPALATVSHGYSGLQGRFLTCYSPVRRSPHLKAVLPRLACVRRAASVRPEPGSNSPLENPNQNRLRGRAHRAQTPKGKGNLLGHDVDPASTQPTNNQLSGTRITKPRQISPHQQRRRIPKGGVHVHRRLIALCSSQRATTLPPSSSTTQGCGRLSEVTRAGPVGSRPWWPFGRDAGRPVGRRGGAEQYPEGLRSATLRADPEWSVPQVTVAEEMLPCNRCCVVCLLVNPDRGRAQQYRP